MGGQGLLTEAQEGDGQNEKGSKYRGQGGPTDRNAEEAYVFSHVPYDISDLFPSVVGLPEPLRGA